MNLTKWPTLRGANTATMKNDYKALLSLIEGLQCWGFFMGQAGLTFEIGKPFEQEGSLRGDFSIWIRTRFRVVNQKKLIVEADFPLDEHLPMFEELFGDKSVAQVGLDTDDNSLRLLVGASCLLSVFPGSEKRHWLLYKNNPPSKGYLDVYQDRVEGPLA